MSKDSTHQNRVTVIPANPEAVKEAQKRKERRDAATEELIHLQHRLLSASIQLEEDDAIISLLQSKRDKLAEEIVEMKERRKELEKELSEL